MLRTVAERHTSIKRRLLALPIIAPNWKPSKCPSTGYTGVQLHRETLLSNKKVRRYWHRQQRGGISETMSSERSQTLKNIYCEIPFNFNSRSGKAKLQGLRTDQWLLLVEGGAGTDCQVAWTKKELLRVTESFYFLMMMVVTRGVQVCQNSYTINWVHTHIIKGNDSMPCFNKTDSKSKKIKIKI